ncbi:threonine aldolase family protein [Sinosporangium siamense]|uniref:Threonine aldolase n=1 Tax=Sinosporangium siamense TaxID=1367973 RepID=A0A919VB44_9ACTN|nr:aminotransferase class V-fold PLP-dependent enzyme [Sinosporangium siamense]GII97171.1 threonine aldolase [Sinosporangium siamense]
MRNDFPPVQDFASDNHAGVHPLIMAALAEANTGRAPAYGADGWTAAFNERVKAQFGPTAEGFPVFNGAGANLVGLASTLGRYDAVICPATAHIATHETGAAERLLGVKLLTAHTPQGKLTPADITAHLGGLGSHLEPQPKVVSISQITELGTCYTPEEIAALASTAHAHGLLLHMDGARLANAAAHLGTGLRAFTTDAGVDILSFGGTKNGALGAEAVIVLRPDLTSSLPYLRRQSLQLASKMRFVSAQLTALLTDNLWHTNAAHSNAMANRLAAGVSGLPGLSIVYPVESNAVFASLPQAAISALQERFRFHVTDPAGPVVRWMTSFDTTTEDVDQFISAIGDTLKGNVSRETL